MLDVLVISYDTVRSQSNRHRRSSDTPSLCREDIPLQTVTDHRTIAIQDKSGQVVLRLKDLPFCSVEIREPCQLQPKCSLSLAT